MRILSIGNVLILCCALGCAAGELVGCTLLASGDTISARGSLSAPASRARYFVTPQGDPIYLTGSHTHLNLVDRPGEEAPLDFETYLQFLKQHHHNFTKLWAQEDTRHAPLPFKRVGPKFNLVQLEQAYFDRLRARVIAAGKHGIYVAIMLFNGWSVEGKTPNRDVWSKHPFHSANNLNGIDGDLNKDGQGAEVHTLRIPAVTAIQEAYVRKVIESVNDLDNVLYEISNESTGTAENTAWQSYFIKYIHSLEMNKPKQHPVGMTSQWPNENNQSLYDSPAEWISPNSNDGYVVNPPATDRGKVVLNDTDHLWGNGGNVEWVWKSFTRGLNPIFMDVTPPLSNRYKLSEAEEVREAMGDTLSYAQRIDLKNMAPRPDLCSTTYCLVNPGHEYLVYVPPTRCPMPEQRLNECELAVNLSDVDKRMMIEWFSPDTKERRTEGLTLGGSVRTFVSPFAGNSVLYLKEE